jgi:hypothetical protein
MLGDSSAGKLHAQQQTPQLQWQMAVNQKTAHLLLNGPIEALNLPI